MNKISEDVYTAVAELIRVLKAQGQQKIVTLLEHRMYRVSWTSSSELFEELENVLKNFLAENKSGLNDQTIAIAEHIVKAIGSNARK
jgi:hypothetical protein